MRVRRREQAAHEAGQLALDTVEAHADQQWFAAALLRVKAASYAADTFSSEHVWALLDVDKIGPPPEPRALGAVFRRAVRDGLIEATNEWVRGTRPDSHGRPVRIWRRR